jgi:hypothetical protein
MFFVEFNVLLARTVRIGYGYNSCNGDEDNSFPDGNNQLPMKCISRCPPDSYQTDDFCYTGNVLGYIPSGRWLGYTDNCYDNEDKYHWKRNTGNFSPVTAVVCKQKCKPGFLSVPFHQNVVCQKAYVPKKQKPMACSGNEGHGMATFENQRQRSSPVWGNPVCFETCKEGYEPSVEKQGGMNVVWCRGVVQE